MIKHLLVVLFGLIVVMTPIHLAMEAYKAKISDACAMDGYDVTYIGNKYICIDPFDGQLFLPRMK